MLNFYFIADELPNSVVPQKLHHAGGLEEDEFVASQTLGLIERQADYYGKFRWSSEQVRQKTVLLANCPFRANTTINRLLTQAAAMNIGLAAYGD